MVVGGKAVTLSGNTIRDPKNARIYIAYECSYNNRAVENVTVVSKTIRGANTYNSPATNYAAIHVVGDGGTAIPVAEVTISANIIEGARWHGSFAGSAGAGCYSFITTNNNIRNTGNTAILTQALQDAVSSRNMIDTAYKAGIYCDKTLGVLSIIGNIVRDPNRTSVATSRRGIFVGCPSITKATVSMNAPYDSTSASTALLDFSTTTANVAVFGNIVGQNMLNYPSAGLPFVAPGSALLRGAFETSGLGGGNGVVGIRNAGTVPTSNPATDGILYSEDGAAKWRTTAGTIAVVGGDFSAVSANYSALASDRTILATAGASGITVTLPAATKGARYEIKKVDAGAGAVTAATSSSQTIDGAATKALAAQYDKITLVSGGTSWHVL